MSNLTLSDGERHLEPLLHASSLTAVRYGVLSMIKDALATRARETGRLTDRAAHIDKAAAGLCDALGVPDIHHVPAALRGINGRPPRKVVAALREREFVLPVADALEDLELIDLADRVRAWSPTTFRIEGTPLL